MLNHPQGLQFIVDEAHSPASGQLASSSHSALFFEVSPDEDLPMEIGARIEEVNDVESSSIHTSSVSYAAYRDSHKSASTLASTFISAAPGPSTSVTPVHAEKKVLQYQYKSKMEDEDIAQTVFTRFLATPFPVTCGEVLALSPSLRKCFVEGCKVNYIPVFQ
jgi:hypothetical protein